VRARQALVGEQHPRRLPELDDRLQRRGRQTLPSPDEERHPGPSPRLDVQAAGHKGLDRGVGAHPGLIQVPLVLPSHEGGAVQWAHRPQDLHLLIAQSVGIRTDRRLHSKQRDDLKQMVLQDITDGSDTVVEGPAPSTPKSSAMVTCTLAT